MNTNLIDMVDALRTEKIGNAQEAFQQVMSEKINAALDERKIAVAGQIYNKINHVKQPNN